MVEQLRTFFEVSEQTESFFKAEAGVPVKTARERQGSTSSI